MFEYYTVTLENYKKYIDDIYEIYKFNSYYFSFFNNEISINQIIEDIKALPNKEYAKLKRYEIVYYYKKPIAIIDSIKNYKTDGIFWIGLFMIHGKNQKQGIGKLLYNNIEEIIYKQGFNKIELGVLKKNKNALKFWIKQGYNQVRENEDVLVLSKEIKYELY